MCNNCKSKTEIKIKIHVKWINDLVLILSFLSVINIWRDLIIGRGKKVSFYVLIIYVEVCLQRDTASVYWIRPLTYFEDVFT